jgi:cytochrome b561
VIRTGKRISTEHYGSAAVIFHWVTVLLVVAVGTLGLLPALPPNVGKLSSCLSACVHGLLYALLFVIPILGIVTFIWHGRVFDFGLFRLNFGVKPNRSIFHPTEDVHGYPAYVLFALAGVHALAALWHHFIRGDGVLRRMWPL